MKKNRRSQRNKAEKFKEHAQSLLANFTWEKEERLLLEILAEGNIPMNEIREANWTEVSLGLNSVIIRGIELPLPAESIDDFKTALSELKDFIGEEIDPRNTLHKIFTHKTGKEINKTLISP
ncbi:MAG: hypothetical protein PF518_08165 [Spirochaetaceae bacterium]|jgi:hypothetical protein|nr:hypothetical protein [Spirochaetaceae bacterium]